MKKFILGKGYTHFALLKSNNLILNGWDYKGYDEDDLKSDRTQYFFNDLIDLFDESIDKKDIKILTRKSVEKLIDITDTKNWYK